MDEVYCLLRANQEDPDEEDGSNVVEECVVDQDGWDDETGT